MTPFVAAIGAISLGASLAFQGLLSNYAAGFNIILVRPFVVGDTIQVRWRGTYAGFYTGDMAIDDVTINDGPICSSVVNGRGVNLGATTADLTWLSYTSSDYDIEWGLCGFTQGAGAVINFTAEDINKIEQNGNIEVAINGKNITLERTDVEISSQDIEGWLVANEGSLTVALDVTLTDDLKREGIARELVNRIQNLRKDSGFEVTDKIDVLLQNDERIVNAVETNIEYIKTETLTEALEIKDEIIDGIEITFDDVNTKLFIQKH